MRSARRTPTERVEHMLALVEFIETQGGRAPLVFNVSFRRTAVVFP